MTYGTSLLLIAVGAILKWAVSAHVSGISLQTVGTILLIVGIIGLIISALLTAGLFGRRDRVAAQPVVRDRYVDDPRV